LRSNSRARGSRIPPSSLLLLDGDGDFRTALAANLRDDGFHVLEFRAPESLPALVDLEVLRALIIADDIAGEGALTFADRFHQVHPKVPVVMLTAFLTDYLEVQLAIRRFMRVLRKPFDYEVLVDLLKAVRWSAL